MSFCFIWTFDFVCYALTLYSSRTRSTTLDESLDKMALDEPSM